MENEYSLYHFGVKGMRWGKRKGRAASGSDRSGTKGSSEENKSFRRNVGRRLGAAALLGIGQLGIAAAAGMKFNNLDHLKKAGKVALIESSILSLGSAALMYTKNIKQDINSVRSEE